MAEQTTDPTEARTRANLAYILVIGGLIFIGYILYKWGDQKEILTLIIGTIGGTLIGAPIGVYFAGSLSRKANTTVATSGDTTINQQS